MIYYLRVNTRHCLARAVAVKRLWLCYGIAIEAWPIAINNAVTLVLASSVLVMKWWFERGGRPVRAGRE